MATFDQLGDAAAGVSNRLRRAAAIAPEGTVGKVKRTKVRFSDDNAFREDQTLRGAANAQPEFKFEESQARTQAADRLRAQAADAERTKGLAPELRVPPLTPEQETFVANAPGGYPDMKIGGGFGAHFKMTGEAAEAMADSRPYGRRMLNAQQPDLGLGEVAQRSMSVMMDTASPTANYRFGNVNDTLQDVYGAYTPSTPGKVYDLPDEYLGLSPSELRNRLDVSGGENIVDTRPIYERVKNGTYDMGAYGSQQQPYQDISARSLEDMSQATGNMMDEYLASQGGKQKTYQERSTDYGYLQDDFDQRSAGFTPSPGLPFNKPEFLPANIRDALTTRSGILPSTTVSSPVSTTGYSVLQDQLPTSGLELSPGRTSTRLVLPENARVSEFEPTRQVYVDESNPDLGDRSLPNVIIPRQANETTIATLNGSELARRLRQSNPQAYSFLRDKLAPIPNPVQMDFRGAADIGRAENNAIARIRSNRLDQVIMADNAEAMGANTTNFVVKDVNPDEYYLYGSQLETQGNMPDSMLGLSRTYAYSPSDQLRKMGFNSKDVNPVVVPANKVGLGIDITNQDPYTRAVVQRTQPSFEKTALVRDPRYVALDPINPIDQELPGFRYAEGKGLQADITPQMAIAQDTQAAARLRAIAEIEQGPTNRLMGGNIPYAGSEYITPNGDVIQGWSRQSPNQPISDVSLERMITNPNVARRAENATNALALSEGYASSAADMRNALRVANEQTAPHDQVILTQISNQGPGQTTPILGQQMPFDEALAIMQPHRLGGSAEQILRLPVVPTQAPEQTQIAKRLRLAQQVGSPESASIMSDPAMGLYKAIAAVDPGVVPNEIRRGVDYTMVPKGDQGQGYTVQLNNPGEAVIDPTTGQRMRWQGQPIETYNPIAEGNSDVSFGVRPRASRPQIKAEERGQLAQAINEGYVPKSTKDPYNHVILTGDDLADMRGGLSQVEARQAQQHNLVREMMGLPPQTADSLAMEQIISGVPTGDRSVELIRNPPAQGGVFTWGPDDYGYGAAAARAFPSSGPPIQIQSGGMLNAFMTEPLPARFMRPTITQVPATGELVYQRPPQVPSMVQPPRIEGRPDLDWQRSPSFRFPQNIWMGRGGAV